MQKKDVLKTLEFARKLSKKRKFDQSVEMILNFKGIDFKKADNRVEVDVKLPHATGKQGDIKSLVFARDKAFAQDLKGKASRVIMDSDIQELKKKEIDELMKDYTAFFAEGPAMLTVGKYLGQQLAPKGRMPRPIQANVAAFEQILKGASTSTKVTNKKGKFMPVIHLMVGKESFKDEQIADNIMEVYNAVTATLSNKEANIKNIIIKTSMGKPVKVGQDYSQIQEPTKPVPKEKTTKTKGGTAK
ncbi:MAG TPA: hypothetical protein VFF13_05720 [archaeon]|nr:hypothetical protein [archaeon]